MGQTDKIDNDNVPEEEIKQELIGIVHDPEECLGQIDKIDNDTVPEEEDKQELTDIAPDPEECLGQIVECTRL